MKEKDVEAYLRDQVKGKGGKAYKFVSPGNDGVPDRMICMPGERVFFVELKAPGKKSTPLQIRRQEELRGFGFTVFADIDSKAAVDNVMIQL